VKEAQGVAKETEGAGGSLHNCPQGHTAQQQRLMFMGCRWTGRQTQADGKVQWEGWKTVFINSISCTKPQSKPKQNGSDDKGENI